jgi:riboflavin synthase
MFTGIVEAKGVLRRVDGADISVECPFEVAVGDSVSVNGVCLTVASLADGAFDASLSEETRGRTSLAGLVEGTSVNLERPVGAGGAFGGHFVQGHVDAVGRVSAVEVLEGSRVVEVEAIGEVARYLAVKGSVAVDGVSLTVVDLDDDRFTVSLVPHTLETTNLKDKQVGDPVNIEVDVLAKYTERLLRGG